MKSPDKSVTVLVLSMPPYIYATRARKAADAFAGVAKSMFLGFEVAGRTGRRDKAGTFQLNGVMVHQVRVAKIDPATSTLTQIRNLFIAYLPTFFRMIMAALRTRADVVYVANPALSIVGLLHRWRFGSRAILDISERPGLINAHGSLASVFSRIEPFILRRIAKRIEMATVVVPSDIGAVRRFGFTDVKLVRNVPLAAWRAKFRLSESRESGPLIAVIIGSIFEDRGYELILRAVAETNRDADVVHLKIYGPSRPSYLAELQGLVAVLGIESNVEWCGSIDSSQVSDAYLDAHVGLVLYDPTHAGNDGLSNKIMECVSSGRPVVATDLPENREFVDSNQVGWLTEMTAAALADTLRDVAASSELSALSQRCRELGDRELNWEHEFAEVLVLANDSISIGD